MPPGPPRRTLRSLFEHGVNGAVAAILVVAALGAGLLISLAVPGTISKSAAPPTTSPATTVPATTVPGGSSPTTTIPPASSDPAAPALSRAVLQQSDVPPGYIVGLIQGGNSVTGEATLDLCNGTFPSEALRTAREQVAAIDAQGNDVLSTEGVAYRNAAATVQAFHELKSVAARCPSTPVVSPVGEPTVTTHFNPPPDGSWPNVAGVSRLAYDFVTTDLVGTTEHSVAVYLRRGRILMGVYFPNPGPNQVAVDGRTTMAGIVEIFADRLAQLPASLVGG